MEKAKTQRIVGIIVVLALLAILLPLLFGKSETPTQTTSAKTVPVPDAIAAPAVQTASADTVSQVPQNTVTDMPAITPVPPAASATTEQPTEAAATPTPADRNPDALLQNKKAETVAVVSAPAKKPVAVNNAETEKKLVQLKKTAWVVQLGSFRDKNNAHRLADKLRAAGFKAFTHEVKSKHGESTRVYIGPENNQAVAVKLSNKIADQIKLHGIVVSYNPLAL